MVATKSKEFYEFLFIDIHKQNIREIEFCYEFLL